MNNHENGYQDFYKGLEFSEEQSVEWQEGWCAGEYENWLENSNVGGSDD